jgi:hypothetical protein
MRVPISGIVTGFRIKRAAGKNETDVGVIDVLQPGDKTFESALIFIYVHDVEYIQFMLENYADGSLRWINTYCAEMSMGREKAFFLIKILDMSARPLKVLEAPKVDGRAI